MREGLRKDGVRSSIEETIEELRELSVGAYTRESNTTQHDNNLTQGGGGATQIEK